MKCDLQLWSRKAPVSELLQSQRLSEAWWWWWWWWWWFRPISDPSDSKQTCRWDTDIRGIHTCFILWNFPVQITSY